MEATGKTSTKQKGVKMDIEELLQKLFSLKYVSSIGSGRSEEYHIISSFSGQQTIVRNAVEEWYLGQQERQNVKIAELEAKVYAYEKIIANSNFKPLIMDAEGYIKKHTTKEGSVDNG